MNIWSGLGWVGLKDGFVLSVFVEVLVEMVILLNLVGSILLISLFLGIISKVFGEYFMGFL